MASSNEYYPWLSTLNISNFVSVKPWLEDKETSSNYKIWRAQILCLLESQDLLGFINEETQIPERGNESPSSNEKLTKIDKHKLWRRTDRLVTGWILGSMGDDVLNALVGSGLNTSSSREVWIEVENIFSQEEPPVDAFPYIFSQEEPVNAFPYIFSQEEPVNSFPNKGLNPKSEGSMQEEDQLVEVEPEISSHDEYENGSGLNPKSDGAVQEEDRTVDEKGSGSLHFSKYWPLYQAVIRGDWEVAKVLFLHNRKTLEATINSYRETALHVALKTGNRNDFVKNLVYMMSNAELALKNDMGNTALHVAAVVGNKEAATMLVTKNRDLLYILNRENDLPVHLAARSGHKDILGYLIRKSKANVKNSPFVGQLGVTLLIRVIISEFVDVALELVKTFPDLVTTVDESGDSALMAMARTSRVFPSGECFNWWQKFIYSYIPLTWTPKKSQIVDIENLGINPQLSNSTNEGIPLTSTPKISYAGDIENLGIYPEVSNSTNNEGCSYFKAKVWTVIEHLVPAIKDIRHKKVLHKKAIELVKCLCQTLESWPGTEDSGIHKRSLMVAADYGIQEVVELITESFPTDIFAIFPGTGDSIMSKAIENRHENVCNVICQRNYLDDIITKLTDSSHNNLLHMSAKLAPPHKLNLVPGAALQIQRELQWFKEMERIVNISLRTSKNRDGETPRTLFTKEHEDLKRQGEKWMKHTASSCSIAAALIATVVFAAAFTVPGGIDSNTGIPIFWDKTPFILFAIADVISLFTSVTSLLMFLAILTSRYAEEDFLHVLPRRLCIGLLTLFVSITFMMVAFSATAYLTLTKKIGSVLVIPVAALACLPITLFVYLQFPILMDFIDSTYGPGIFRKNSDRSLH